MGKNTQNNKDLFYCRQRVSPIGWQIGNFSVQAEICLSLKQSLQQSYAAASRLLIISRTGQNNTHFSCSSPKLGCFTIGNSLFSALPLTPTCGRGGHGMEPRGVMGTTGRQHTLHGLKISTENSNFIVNNKVLYLFFLTVSNQKYIFPKGSQPFVSIFNTLNQFSILV